MGAAVAACAPRGATAITRSSACCSALLIATAALTPSAAATTTNCASRDASPATNTPGTFVSHKRAGVDRALAVEQRSRAVRPGRILRMLAGREEQRVDRAALRRPRTRSTSCARRHARAARRAPTSAARCRSRASRSRLRRSSWLAVCAENDVRAPGLQRQREPAPRAVPSTARRLSRHSQPSQYGQWKTERP